VSAAVARITVSLPQELKDRLDAYAAERQLPISQVVAQALEQLFDPSRQPAPEPGADEAARAYAGELAAHVESLRRVLWEVSGRVSNPFYPLMNQVPGPLPPPAWPGPESPR
jgi:predicted transcriptional regulator